MNLYDGRLTFEHPGPLGAVAAALSAACCGGMPFIPKDRRHAREYDEAAYCEYDLLGFQVGVYRDAAGPFHLDVSASELWRPAWTPDELASASYHSCAPWLAVLLRSLPGFTPQVDPVQAGSPVVVIDSHSLLNARCTFEEALALFTQKLCCGLRFVPGETPAGGFALERELLGHRVVIRPSPWGGGHYLAVTPSPGVVASLTAAEKQTLVRLDMTNYLQSLLRDHPWLRGGPSLTPEEVEAYYRPEFEAGS
ncbi:MAG TPA: hypothetical protein VD866_01910 [Urbifossiella sp.]|nr:hypothetical protein [Urbifossiella sp.]